MVNASHVDEMQEVAHHIIDGGFAVFNKESRIERALYHTIAFGDGGVRGLATAADYLNLTRRLLAEGINERMLRKVWGGNFLRVMSRVQYNTLQNLEG